MTDIKLPNEHLKALKTAREAIQKEGIEKKGKNEHFGNTYATLDDIIDKCEAKLLENNLLTSFTQTYDNVDKDKVEQYQCFYTMRITHIPSMRYVESHITLYSDRRPQQLGSCMTYAKRYLYQNMLMLKTVEEQDDDGNKADLSMKGKVVGKINREI